MIEAKWPIYASVKSIIIGSVNGLAPTRLEYYYFAPYEQISVKS